MLETQGYGRLIDEKVMGWLPSALLFIKTCQCNCSEHQKIYFFKSVSWKVLLLHGASH